MVVLVYQLLSRRVPFVSHLLTSCKELSISMQKESTNHANDETIACKSNQYQVQEIALPWAAVPAVQRNCSKVRVHAFLRYRISYNFHIGLRKNTICGAVGKLSSSRKGQNVASAESKNYDEHFLLGQFAYLTLPSCLIDALTVISDCVLQSKTNKCQILLSKVGNDASLTARQFLPRIGQLNPPGSTSRKRDYLKFMNLS